MKLRFLFHFSLLLLIALEAYRAFLLLPFPGSQLSPAVDVSYFLYHYRWWLRVLLFAGVVIGFSKAFERRPWIPMITLFFAGMIYYLANFEMTAEHFFHEAAIVQFGKPADSGLPMDALVIGVTDGKESHAFPIRYLAFHHQVHDVIGGQHLLVTYCDVCRSGIVFDPGENVGRGNFRLVGMDQWNAMFEDVRTGSWWAQATGECIAGELKGTKLQVYPSEQLTLAAWMEKHPDGKVMLPDPESVSKYGDETFEKGTIVDELTGTDTASWHDKSWVIGIERNGNYRAYDWNALKRERIIHDELGGEQIMITIDNDNVNFRAFVMNTNVNKGDTLIVGMSHQPLLSEIPARQVFWHTWKTFFPFTTQYGFETDKP